MTALEILRQMAQEIHRPDYDTYQDRVLAMIDCARRTIAPAKGRSAELHCLLVEVGQAAQCELAKTYLKTSATVGEEESYVTLMSLGGMSRQDCATLVADTILRLEQTQPVPIAAE